MNFLFKLFIFAFSFLILNVTHSVYADSCIPIRDVTYTTPTVQNGSIFFKCEVTVDSTNAGSRNIACGIRNDNKNFPANYCPSDPSYFGGWNGNKAEFNCAIPSGDTIIDPNLHPQLVGRDFQTPGCDAANNGKPVPLTGLPYQATTTSTPTNQNTYQTMVKGLLDAFLSMTGNTKSVVTSNEPITQTNIPPIEIAIPTIAQPNLPINIVNLPPINSQSTGSLDEENSLKVLSMCNPQITTKHPIAIQNGIPTISYEQFQRVLTVRNSPAAGEGKAMYDMGIHYGIEPGVLLAFFIKESSVGTCAGNPNCLSARAKNIGNLICTDTWHGDCLSNSAHPFRVYNSWTDGAEDFYILLRETYLQGWGLTSIETIIPKYAPGFENDTCGYINDVLSWYDAKFSNIK